MSDLSGDSPPTSDLPPGETAVDDRVFLVPLGWWREAEEGLGEEDNGVRGIPYLAAHSSPSYYGMKLINNIFSSDLAFNLRRDGDAWENGVEVGVSGKYYALLPSDLWSMAIKRHAELKNVKNNGQLSFSSNDAVDAYPLMLRISVQRETSVLTVKISKKDNSVDYFKRASKIFAVDTEPVRIWDFSGQTNLIVMNEWNRLPQDSHQKNEQEILLEVQVYGLLENNNSGSDSSKQLKINHSGSNGSIGNLGSDFLKGNSKGGGPLGLIGLENLGNTCFMNSAIQCLTHTPQLVDFFLGDYSNEINHHNPLGLKGELAVAFGDLLRLLWASDRAPVVPRAFKSKLSRFAPQFSGFSQHDSQELLAFLLDGLHEDLNRVKCKPYAEVKDAAGRPDEEVADEYWGNHVARNNSIIVDICQGQYKSTLLCPVCQEVSVTFDPFMYLSLPLPSTTTRAMTVTIFSTDGFTGPSAYTVNVPKLGKLKDLIQALSIACSLRDDENLLIAEVFSNRIIRFLEEPSDSLTLIRDEDRLAAYRIPKDRQSPLVVFVHQKLEENYFLGKRTSNWKGFGVPLLTLLPNDGDESTICKLFMKILSPFMMHKDTGICDNRDKCTENPDEVAQTNEMEGCSSCGDTAAEAMVEDSSAVGDFEFYFTDEKSQAMQSKIEMNEPLSLTGMQKHLYVLVNWQGKALEQCDVSLLNTLTDVYKFRTFSRKTQESFSLYACLEAFLKEEPLGPDDMWYCPSCKKHQQASKKLDLWRLPEVLVIHLKRFTYSRYLKTKLETYVDFPIHDLDFSPYVSGTSAQSSYHYRLYAISNHYGNMGGGHYTAYAYHEGESSWYNFDDQNVHSLAEESIKTSAAYVLFYRRI